ncbi:MAG: ThiF family adenylyltransferase [Deltaproteobacteria bacterium]|nr:ThiF family adenylyltransferase [Deltaproteobacteria bacterium]MBW2071937.1 ThiF family adenylyltransferase [Deltaproteobacteria bacterium]
MSRSNDAILSEELQRRIASGTRVEQVVEALVEEFVVPKWQLEALCCDLGHVLQRYERNLGVVGLSGQATLLRAKVMVVGLGGLGGHVLDQLSRSGVGRIAAVDADLFDLTNLNRQLLALRHTVGTKKTNAARERVAAVNDAVQLISWDIPLEELPDMAYEGLDLIFDCLDQIPTRLHLQEKASRFHLPIVHGAIGGWYGQVAVVQPDSGLLGALYGKKRQGIEKDLGNPAFSPTVIAGIMVAEGIKVLLDKEETLKGVLFVDLLNNQVEVINI